MANNPQFYDVGTIAELNALTALLNSGFLNVYSGAQPILDGAITGTRLAHLTLSATAFATAVASGGTVTATANAIGSDTNAVGGTAGYFALLKSDGTTVIMTGSVGTSNADLVLSTTSVTGGGTFSIADFAITQLQ
jgi:hypothetical protein